MNIGIRLHDTAPGTLAERLDFARAQGFSCAHVALSKTVDGFRMQDAPERLMEAYGAELKALFLEKGMDCAVLGCYLTLAQPEEEERARTQAIYRAHLRFAKWMGAGVVGTETPAADGVRYDPAAPESEEAFQLFLNSLRPVVRWAEEEDTILAVEPVYRHIVSTQERTERMLEAIPSDHLRIILDAVNLLGPETAERADEIIAEAVRRLGEKVSVLHMKDFVRKENELVSCACGTGHMRYETQLSLAKQRNLPMTLEDTHPGNAEAARRYLENQAARLG